MGIYLSNRYALRQLYFIHSNSKVSLYFDRMSFAKTSIYASGILNPQKIYMSIKSYKFVITIFIDTYHTFMHCQVNKILDMDSPHYITSFHIQC